MLLWVLTISVLGKKNIIFFSMNVFILYKFKILRTLHVHAFVMNDNLYVKIIQQQ